MSGKPVQLAPGGWNCGEEKLAESRGLGGWPWVNGFLVFVVRLLASALEQTCKGAARDACDSPILGPSRTVVYGDFTARKFPA